VHGVNHRALDLDDIKVLVALIDEKDKWRNTAVLKAKKQAKSVISPLVVMNGTGFSVIKDGSSVPCARTVVFYP
jgi:hypothetical protein